ncbi:hypothetical protein GCM10008985_12690 [Halococcus dombrowskii]|uniref:Uncharacterized protein n=1 Tax=Halococcus dombrowskii TaxID=179637 RepID=A0AAV3SFH9_HALDO
MVRWIDADETVCEPTQFFEDPRGERSVGGSESEELVCAVATDCSVSKQETDHKVVLTACNVGP